MSDESSTPQGSDEPLSCRTDDGQTVGLVDSLLFIAREVAGRDLTSAQVQASLADLDEDPALKIVLGALRR